MPIALGVAAIDEVWQAIDYEVTWLHGRWAIYRQLYGTSEARVDVLNQSAGTFARMLQDVLLDDVQLGLAKLGDPASTPVRGGRAENLTLKNLLDRVIASGVLASELPPLLRRYEDACASIRDRRNKRIAHADLQINLEAKASLLGPSREEIEVALKALRDVMNGVELHFTGTRTAYEFVVLQDDGDSLIAALTRGLRYQELVEQGAIPRDDLLSSRWGKV
ncbi:hypothetical protein ACQQ2N_00230 [Dokdonella sp. MW10]|uniref:AbiU2 domain-containing protein n=1 Tax=Dokdonella sp. MW10 TaxID=2992926 RepID=UPI003F7D033C